MVENPAWVRWNRELIAARAEQAQRQAEAHVAHERDLAAYQRALRDWEAERVSPAGEARRQARNAVKSSYGLAPVADAPALRSHGSHGVNEREVLLTASGPRPEPCGSLQLSASVGKATAWARLNPLAAAKSYRSACPPGTVGILDPRRARRDWPPGAIEGAARRPRRRSASRGRPSRGSRGGSAGRRQKP